MPKFKVNQSVNLKDNAKSRSWFPNSGEVVLWVEKVYDNGNYDVFDGQWTFTMSEDELEKSSAEDISYF